MSWKIGEYAWICGSEAYGVSEFQEPLKVKILDIQRDDMHPFKVVDAVGHIFYVTEKEIQTRQAKAKRKPASLIVTDKVRKEAEKMAEKRIEELKKPAFSDVVEDFYALVAIGAGEGAKEAKDRVISLAERALYEKIKDGVVWEDQDR